jgi:membrane peptidoglycan carboxypeptidase
LIQEGLRGVVRIPTGTAHALDSRAFPIAVMGKTGTTNEFRDALFVGSTYGDEGITVAIRIGFDDNQSLGAKETGARVALPVFQELMLRVYQEGIVGESDGTTHHALPAGGDSSSAPDRPDAGRLCDRRSLGALGLICDDLRALDDGVFLLLHSSLLSALIEMTPTGAAMCRRSRLHDWKHYQSRDRRLCSRGHVQWRTRRNSYSEYLWRPASVLVVHRGNWRGRW